MKFIRALLRFVEHNGPVLAVLPGPFLLIGWKLVLGQVLFWGTTALQFVPWWFEAWRQISQGIFPVWNSMNGMGAPLLANYQTAFFYPPNWILLPLAAVWGAPGIAIGFTLLAMIHMILAGLGTVFLLRRLGVNSLAQAVGGVAFSMSGYLIGRLEFISMAYVFAWLPWVFKFADELDQSQDEQIPHRRFVFSIPLAAAVGMMLLAGHAQLSWYTLMFSSAWVLVKAFRGGWRALWAKLASFGFSCLAGGLIAAVQLLPTAEYLLQSQRSAAVGYADAVLYSFWPWRILTLFAPDLFGNPGRGDFWGYATYWEDATYIGMLPVLLALTTFFALFKKASTEEKKSPTKLTIFLWIFIVIGFILALGQNGFAFPFLYKYVPTFSLFQAPARYLIWAELGLVILAAFGIDRWRCPQKRGLYWLRLATAGAFAVTLGAGLAWLTLGSVKATFIRAAALAGLWCLGTGVLTLLLPYFEKRSWKPAWNGLVYAWVLVDIVAAGWSLNPMIPVDFYSGGDHRIAEICGEIKDQLVYIPKEDLQTLKFERFLRFSDFRPLEDWRNLRAVMLPNMNLLEGIESANNFDPMVPSRYSGWLGAVEDSSAQTRDLWLQAAGVSWLEVVDSTQSGGVRFDPLQSQPRFAYFSCAVSVESSEDVITRFQKAAPGERLLVIEGQRLPDATCLPQTPAKVEILTQVPGKVVLSVEAPADGWVSAAMVYYPGWQVSVDGQSGQLLRANYLFMAVPVEQGYHTILLQYNPRAFFLGLLLSILVLVMLVVRVIQQKASITAN